MADNDLIRIETPEPSPYPLGRHVWHDPRNKQHRALAAPPELLPDRNSMFSTSVVFDQRGSSCTVQSDVGMCMTSPFTPTFKKWWPLYDTEDERHATYLIVQNYDPWPGGEPEYEGSSTDAPLKLLRERGHITGWKWLFGFDEVKQWVMYHGPCSVGTNWYQSMFTVDTKGFIRIAPRSTVAGGHAWRIIGYSVSRKAFRLVNSWGRDWGQSGRAWIGEEDLRRLLSEDGEAVTLA